MPVNADSQSKADVAINEVERLINQEKVDIVNGVYSSAHAVPLAAKVEAQKKILWITTAVATAVFKDKNLKYVFRAQIHSDQYGEAFAGFLAENAKAKLGVEPKDVKVAHHPRGRALRRRRRRSRASGSPRKAGLQIVLREGYSATAPDLSSLVTKLKRAGADVISHAGYNPDITLFLRQARESGLRFKMLVGNGAGYSQLDKLRATFGKDIDNFCNIDPVPAQLLDPTKLAPGIGDLIKIMVERYKAKTNATDVPPHCSMGFNQTWVLLNNVLPVAKEKYGGFDRRGGAQGRARRRHPAGRHHPGLWREVLSARHADVRAERALDAGRHAECRRAHLGGLADQHPDAGRRCCRCRSRRSTPCADVAGDAGSRGAVASASEDSWRSIRCPSKCARARSWASSGRTARARARRST